VVDARIRPAPTQSAINAGDSVDASYSAWAQYVPNDSSDHTLDMTVNAVGLPAAAGVLAGPYGPAHWPARCWLLRPSRPT
jgi:hypothetical protein